MVLVHYGDAGVTRRCVESLAALESHPHRVYIANHSPEVDLEACLAGCHPDLRILAHENSGFGPGCNAAAQAAFRDGAPLVWFLNNDATLEEAVLGRLTELSRAHPEVGLWGTLQDDGPRRVGADRLPKWFPERPPHPAPAPPSLPSGCTLLGPRETLSGASILITREAWERLGPWPEEFFLYWEDVAWGLRAHAKGLPIVMTDLVVRHARCTTTGRHSELATYYGVRNELLLHRELWPGLGAARLRHGLHILQKRFFQGNWGMLAPTLRGLRDARAGVMGKRP